VATCSKSGVPRRGNCVDHNARSEYVVQSAERSREQKGTETIGEQMSHKYTGDRSAMDTVVCHQHNFKRNVLRHGQPVKSVVQCWHDVVISPDACD